MGKKIVFDNATKIDDQATEYFDSTKRKGSSKISGENLKNKKQKPYATPIKRVYVDLNEEELNELDNFLLELKEDIGLEIKRQAVVKSMYLKEFNRRLKKK
jgi:hypothetical protein